MIKLTVSFVAACFAIGALVLYPPKPRLNDVDLTLAYACGYRMALDHVLHWDGLPVRDSCLKTKDLAASYGFDP